MEERTCVGCVEGLYRVKLWFPLGHNTQQASYETQQCQGSAEPRPLHRDEGVSIIQGKGGHLAISTCYVKEDQGTFSFIENFLEIRLTHVSLHYYSSLKLLMAVSGNHHQWILELVDESMMRMKRIFASSQSMSPEDTVFPLNTYEFISNFTGEETCETPPDVKVTVTDSIVPPDVRHREGDNVTSMGFLSE